MADKIDENPGAAPGDEPAGASQDETPAMEAAAAATPTDEAPTDAMPTAESPTMVQTSASPASAATSAAVPPRRDWFRKRWVLIAGGVAAAAVLLLGGVAIGNTIGGHDGWDGHRGMDGPGQFRQDGNGFGPQAYGQGRGGFDRDGDRGFGHGGSRGGDQCGRPQQGAPQPYGTPQPQGTPQGQSATPQVQ